MIVRLTATEYDKNHLISRSRITTPIEVDFSKLLVHKPWGEEYLLYKNSEIEVWNLLIKSGEATSMHCHPNKKTSLLILEGRVLFSSLDRSIELSSMSMVVLEPGVFHSTRSISSGGARVLEFETPPMKGDIVRLEDTYGRANSGYEGLEAMTVRPDLVRFSIHENDVIKKIHNKEIYLKSLSNIEELIYVYKKRMGIVVVLGGRISSEKREILYGPGDILDLESFKNFDMISLTDLSILIIDRRN